MKLVVINKENSDRARSVYEFLELFSRKYPDKEVEVLEAESKEGAIEASLYGAVDYPAFIVKDNSGVMISMWQGQALPLIDEIAGYLVA